MKISHDDYLKAKGLYHLVQEAYVNAPNYHKSLMMLLKLPNNFINHVSDSVLYGGNFDEMLKLDDIEVDEAKMNTQNQRHAHYLKWKH